MRNEVAANVRRCVDVRLIARVQVPAVPDLQRIKDDPVDGRDDGVECKGCVSASVLAPDGVAVVFAFVWMAKVVVNTRYYDEEP